MGRVVSQYFWHDIIAIQRRQVSFNIMIFISHSIASEVFVVLSRHGRNVKGSQSGEQIHFAQMAAEICNTYHKM